MTRSDGIPSAASRRVRVPKTAELVAAKLRREIVFGQLQEGDPLASESELMSEFGVSRPTLREAFRILESEGLISVVRGAKGGARVHSPSSEVAARYTGWVLQFQQTSLAEIYAARVTLEANCAGILAGRRTKKDLDRLRNAMEESRRAVETLQPATDSQALAAAQLVVHGLIVQLAGNRALILLAEMIDVILNRADIQYAEMTQSRDGIQRLWELGNEGHATLLELLEAGDSVGAESHWRTHLQASADRVLRGLGSKSVIEFME